MLNILINAYAVNPYWGSEQGMGWNWVINIARYCNVYVITEGEFKDNIEEAVMLLPQKDNLHFYYNPLPDKVRQMCWNQGDWRFYWYYRKWQQKTLQIAKGIIADNRIDVVHQLNMIGFREPGYLWKIEGIPFVWGPIGGMELMPLSFLKGTSMSQYIKVWVKNVINDWQRKHHPRVLQAIHRASALIAATKGCADVIREYHHRDVVLINETGCGQNDALEKGRAAARSMDTKARVTPRSLASAATSASDMKQCTSPPSEARIVLLIPALTIWVSVTMSQPARRAAMAFCTAWPEKARLST